MHLYDPTISVRKFEGVGLKQARTSDSSSIESDRVRTSQSTKHFSRVGGRKVRRQKPKQKRPNSLPLILPLALVFYLFFSQPFGSRGNPSYVYYQSSVYESTVVGSDGRAETSRQESIKSNLPELVRKQRAIAGGQDGRSISLNDI